MAVFNEPTQWEHPLGNNADTSTLPDDAVATAGIASLQKLFQIINATPLEAGGIAPAREDVNALFKYLGDFIFYAMNGGEPSYNAAYDYIAGRVVLYNGNLYKCIQANGVSSTVVTPDSNTEFWQRLDNFVRSVNGINADTQGDVQLEGLVKSVNGVTADASGNVTISASCIPDYSSGINIASSLGAGKTWTAPKSGILIHTSLSDNGSCYISHTNANNYENWNLPNWLIYNNTGNGDYQSAMAIVNKNLVVYGASNASVIGTLMFYPFK